MDIGSMFLQGGNGPGVMGSDGLEMLNKALTAGYGTDEAQLSGGGALRVQSLDRQMQATIQTNANFKLFNMLPKSKATATVDEWTEQSDVGGFPGGSFNGETAPIAGFQGTYNRRTGSVKYLQSMRQVSMVVALQGSIQSAQAVEELAGAKQLLTDAEIGCFEGNSAVVPEQFDGIYSQMAQGVAMGLVDGGNIIDARGGPLNSIDYVTEAAATIAGEGNYGTPTDIFLSQFTQADLDNNLQPAFRVPLSGQPESTALGTPVTAINTSYGKIANRPDVFIRDQVKMTPFELRYPAVAALNLFAPVSVTVQTAANASSLFTAPQAGNYYWYVTGVTKLGESFGTMSAQTAVAAGQGAVLTITQSQGGTEGGYVIYRSRQNGTNAPSDMREMARIAKTQNSC
jgi:hypothetical protein